MLFLGGIFGTSTSSCIFTTSVLCTVAFFWTIKTFNRLGEWYFLKQNNKNNKHVRWFMKGVLHVLMFVNKLTIHSLCTAQCTKWGKIVQLKKSVKMVVTINWYFKPPKDVYWNILERLLLLYVDSCMKSVWLFEHCVMLCLILYVSVSKWPHFLMTRPTHACPSIAEKNPKRDINNELLWMRRDQPHTKPHILNRFRSFYFNEL